MKQVHGIWLPDNDTHFEGHLNAGPKIDGVGTYQHNKFLAVMHTMGTVGASRGVALDIGAHVGLWSRSLAREFDIVIAFEPVPEHIECFKRNLDGVTNKIDKRVVLWDVALGFEEGLAFIDLTPGNSGNSHVSLGGPIVNSIQARMHRLDDYALAGHRRIDFIKIDVEGYELDVIKGGKDIILRHKPVMLVEQKPGHGFRYGVSDTAAVDLLKTWGATEAWVKSGDYCMVWK